MRRRPVSQPHCSKSCSSALLNTTSTFFFGKKSSNNNNAVDPAAATTTSGSGGGSPFDPRRVQEFMKSTPQQQLDMMQRAVEMQKTMGKVPGLGILARKNAEMMEKVIQMQQNMVGGKAVDPNEKRKVEEEMKQMLSQRGINPDQAINQVRKAATEGASGGSQSTSTSSSVPPPPHSPPSKQHVRGKASTSLSSGPTLDELRKINLGSEIEALFEELRSIREVKNSFRDKYYGREKECEELNKEARTLRETEHNVRQKLQAAEKNVMLLNSENMTLRDEAKKVHALDTQVSKLQRQVDTLKGNDTAPLLARIQELENNLRAKEDHERSLLRKLDRTRRRDPLLQFSQVCASAPRHLVPQSSASTTIGSATTIATDFAASAMQSIPDVDTTGGVTTADLVDEAYVQLRLAYDQEQRRSWEAAAAKDGLAAKVMVAAAADALLPWLGRGTAKLDAVVQLDVSVGTKTFDFVSEMKKRGFNVQTDPSHQGKYVVALPATAESPTVMGPYGVACALLLAQLAPQQQQRLQNNNTQQHAFGILSVAPHVSADLVSNVKRASIEYESCRSGGPGGQAANVSETQISAKLVVDGMFLFKSEAQDSRSAVANKDAATERLHTVQRKHWNDRTHRFDANRVLQEAGISNGSVGRAASIGATYGEENLSLLENAVVEGHVSKIDEGIVLAVEAMRNAVGRQDS